jgi:RNA polymerase sigma-70 factor (ECF subfamily)
MFDKWILSDALLSLSADHRTVIVRAYFISLQTVADIAQQRDPEAP